MSVQTLLQHQLLLGVFFYFLDVPSRVLSPRGWQTWLILQSVLSLTTFYDEHSAEHVAVHGVRCSHDALSWCALVRAGRHYSWIVSPLDNYQDSPRGRFGRTKLILDEWRPEGLEGQTQRARWPSAVTSAFREPRYRAPRNVYARCGDCEPRARMIISSPVIVWFRKWSGTIDKQFSIILETKKRILPSRN